MQRDVEQAARGADTAQPAAVTSPAVEPPAPKPAPPVAAKPRAAAGDRTEERVRMSKRRATIARRLVEAQSTAAMLTTFNEVDMSAVMALRERHKQAFKERHGVGLGHRVVLRQGVDRRAARVPADQRRDPGRRDGAQALLRHRRRRRRQRRARRAGAARRRSHVVRRDRSSRSASFAKARGGRHAVARRSQGRHVHDHQRRRLRVAAEHADPESAAGRHPRPARDPGAPGRRRTARSSSGR